MKREFQYDRLCRSSLTALALLAASLSVASTVFALPVQAIETPGALSDTGAASNTGADKATANSPVWDKWALIVGVSKFNDGRINLKYAAKDAQDFANFLIKEENFAPDHVLLLTDEQATRKNILEALGSKWLPRLAYPGDLVVLYFSTHGSPSEADEGGVNYLITHDTEIDDLYATGIPMQDLSRMIKGRVHADRVVIFLDACHSGATTADGKGIVRVGNVNADDIAQGTGQLVISSSAPNERSWESKDESNGVFTKHLITALKKNGTSTKLGSAFSELKENVQAEVLRDRAQLQTPVLRSKWEGNDLALGATVTKPRPGIAFVPELESADSSKAQTATTGAASESAKASGAIVGTSPGAAGSSPNAAPPLEITRRGVDGEWDSNWGKVTMVHGAIVDDKPVKVTGYWIQGEEKNRGIFRSGTFDPKTGILKLSYWQSWNFMLGSATFKMSADGKRLEGSWKHLGLVGDPWIIWRK